jgi:hypothetical protein
MKKLDLKAKSFKIAKIGSRKQTNTKTSKKCVFVDFAKAQIAIEFHFEKA